MKLHYFLVFAFSLGFSNCKKETQEPFIPKNYLANFITEKPQLFDLGTIEYKEIVGKHGTKVIFSRDFFELKENQKVQLELIELYDFKEILYRNIQTVTTNDELLETSGVLKIVFTSNGKKLKLKKGEKIIIEPLKEKFEGNDAFLSYIDSTQSIKWKETEVYIHKAQITTEYSGGLHEETSVIHKSIKYFDENNLSNWISIAKHAKIKNSITFNLENKNKSFGYFKIYFIHKNKDYLLMKKRYRSNLKFKNIPVVNNKTKAIIISNQNNELFYDKIELHESHNNSELKLNMKKISEKELQRIINKNI